MLIFHYIYIYIYIYICIHPNIEARDGAPEITNIDVSLYLEQKGVLVRGFGGASRSKNVNIA